MPASPRSSRSTGSCSRKPVDGQSRRRARLPRRCARPDPPYRRRRGLPRRQSRLRRARRAGLRDHRVGHGPVPLVSRDRRSGQGAARARSRGPSDPDQQIARLPLATDLDGVRRFGSARSGWLLLGQRGLAASPCRPGGGREGDAGTARGGARGRTRRHPPGHPHGRRRGARVRRQLSRARASLPPAGIAAAPDRHLSVGARHGPDRGRRLHQDPQSAHERGRAADRRLRHGPRHAPTPVRRGVPACRRDGRARRHLPVPALQHAGGGRTGASERCRLADCRVSSCSTSRPSSTGSRRRISI